MTKITRPAHWKAPANTLQGMKVYLEQKLSEVVGMPEKERATFSAYVFLVAATSPKDYKECVDRYLERIPAGTPYAHQLHLIHQSITEWVQPKKRPYTSIVRTRGVGVSLYISDATKQQHEQTSRYSYFVQLLQQEGVAHPVPERVGEYIKAWIYARIDEAIAGDRETITE